MGTNMYAYCQGNPVNLWDPAGTDAIYAVIFSNGGMKGVGHSLLMLQDANGDWWATEFIGYDENVFVAMKKARVNTWITEKGDTTWKRISTPHDGVKSGACLAYIKGDFTKGLEIAKEYAEGDGKSFGAYNPLWNNCQHYVLEIMLTAQGVDKGVMDVIISEVNKINPIASLPLAIPIVFYGTLIAALRLTGVKKPK